MSPSVYDWTRAWAQSSGFSIWASEETGSTNTVAKDDLSPAHKKLYLTRHQTQGRGRGAGRTWIVDRDASLTASWSFTSSQHPQPVFSPLAGLALYRALMSVWPSVDFNLKAPNDLYVGQKKLCGILIEIVDRGSQKTTVIGLGMNVFAYPQDVSIATCLKDHLGRSPSAAEWHSFLTTWTSALELALTDGYLSQLKLDAREALCQALNKHPLLTEPILKVDELGQLHKPSGIVLWHEL